MLRCRKVVLLTVRFKTFRFIFYLVNECTEFLLNSLLLAIVSLSTINKHEAHYGWSTG